MALKIHLFMLLVILGITAHAQLSGHPQGKKCVADHREQICVDIRAELMFLVLFFVFVLVSVLYVVFAPLCSVA